MFRDLTVVELASVLAGPAVGTFFAELGARVIKVENATTGGDMTRKWRLPGEDRDAPVSAYYASVNYRKEILYVDLGNDAARQEIYDLVARADVVIANFKKGDDTRFGVDYERLREIRPDLVYASISGFGGGSDRVAFDVVLQAETGFMSMNGTPDSGPVKMPVALIDVLAAHQLKEAILCALIHRMRTGEGSRVSVSLFAAGVASLVNQASNWLMCGHVPGRIGSLHPNIAPYGDTFRCRDGRDVVLAVGTDRQFRSLVTVLGDPGLADDERFATNPARVRNRDALTEALAALFAAHDAEPLAETLHGRAVPAGLIRTVDEVFAVPEAADTVLEETIEGVSTRRARSVAFEAAFIDAGGGQ
jgi:crotonobetainyl-CoA:carnitine CoA-transferase CaiB-like acyl-CoA transferase